MSEIKITEVEATVLRLEPGDVLAVKVKGDDFNHEATLQGLKEHVQSLFPNNKVLLFSMDSGHEIEFNILKGDTNEHQS